MGIRTTAKKSYPIAANGEEPGTVSPPTVGLRLEIDASNTDKFNIVIVIKNSSEALLKKEFIGVTDGGESFDVQNIEFLPFEKDRTHTTRFTLTASNSSVGGVATASIDVGPANTTVIDLPGTVIRDFSIAREENTYNLVNIKLNLIKSDFFDISKLDKLELFYKKQDEQNSQIWKRIELSTVDSSELKDDNEKVVGYLFYYKQPIGRDDFGAYYNFYIKVSFKNNTPQETDKKDLFFDNLNTTKPGSRSDSSVSTDVIDTDNPASLRYEVLTKFSEFYKISTNIKQFANAGEDGKPVEESLEDARLHEFLDTTVYKGVKLGRFYLRDTNGDYFFHYEQDKKGHFYPASVSEIHPCIIKQNEFIVLFWKINENFFNYSFFENQISIITNSFKVKLQYLDANESYVDLTGAIEITKEGVKDSRFGFYSANQKFILLIKRSDVIGNIELFNKISEEDNRGANLRLLVVEHGVTCSSRGVPSVDYLFDKMLIPPQWKYIAYDKYIPRDVEVRSNKKINLDLNSPILRGIRLPKEGFYEYDSIFNEKTLGDTINGQTPTFTSDSKILYKLDCQYDVFYKDPVLEGTVNLISLPQTIPKDVFLIPPSLEIPAPNLDKNGRQAEGIVKLDEYGKISGIQITNPGSGYSLFKTVGSKRQQTFTDLTPFVTQIFKIVAADLNINRQNLIPQNASFDKDNLKASLKGGVRLASSYFDRLKLQQDNQNAFSVEQKQRLDEYLNFDIPSNIEEIANSKEAYDLNYTLEQKDLNSIGVLDEAWNIISKLYTEKNTNPAEEVQIYTEDSDAGVSEISESQIPSTVNYTQDPSSITPISLNADSPQQGAEGGEPELFSLNNLEVMPDASAAVFITQRLAAPPSLTLLPTSVRADGQYGFGPLPNMAPRAEMFNRLVMGINNLNEVRVILPMIWALDQKNEFFEYWDSTPLAGSQYDLISFSTAGQKIDQSNEGSSYIPINSVLSVSAFKSVEKININLVRSPERGVSAGNYKLSTEFSSSITIRPFIHPLMARSFKESYLRTFKRKILGIVSELTTVCAINQAPMDFVGRRVVPCYYRSGGTSPTPVLEGALLPTENVSVNTYFAFFNAGGVLEAKASGTAQSLSITAGGLFCNNGCGDAFSKTVDFSYAYIFPGTIKI